MTRKLLLLCLTLSIAFVDPFPGIGVRSDRLAQKSPHPTRHEYECLEPVSQGKAEPAPAVTPIQVVNEMLEQIDPDRALTGLRKLTGEEPIIVGTASYTITDRASGDGLDLALGYLYENLSKLDYSVEFQGWSHFGYADRNLIATKPGVISPTEKIYFVAHVDGIGSWFGDRCPSADDNASSVADGLEMARVLNDFSFGRTIVLLFTTGEEAGMFGAHAHVDQLSAQELNSIKYVITGDMIGYDENGDRWVQLYYGDHLPSLALAQVMSETIAAYQLDLVPNLSQEEG